MHSGTQTKAIKSPNPDTIRDLGTLTLVSFFRERQKDLAKHIPGSTHAVFTFSHALEHKWHKGYRSEAKDYTFQKQSPVAD